jgi:hypothetical protein
MTMKPMMAGLLWLFSGAVALAQQTTGPLRVSSENPRYFTDGSGKAVYLTGSHTWGNLEDRGTLNPPSVAFDYTGYLKFLVSHNHNWFRLWTSEVAHASPSDDPDEDYIAAPYKWVRAGPGTANDGALKYDFTQLDPNYFSRMRARIIQAGQSGIYVSVMLFNGYMWQFDLNASDGNPFEAGNNVNGVGLGGTSPSDSSQLSAAAWGYEQAYLKMVVDTVNDLNNVMYEVSNEAGAYSTTWQANVISYVKTYQATKPNQHPVGMTFQYSGGSDSTLYSSAADWVSPSAQVPPGNGTKVIIVDTDHAYYWVNMKNDGQPAQQAWVWKNFLGGCNVAFMDPYLVVWPSRNAPSGSTADPFIGTAVDPYWEVLRSAMGRARSFAQKMNLIAMTPQGGLSSTGYCLAHPGAEYLVYQPASGAAFTVNLAAGTYSFEWYNPSAGSVASTGTLTAAGGNQTFTAGFGGDSVLYLVSTGGIVAPAITTQPVSQTVTAGQTASFGVKATGTAPLAYQWQEMAPGSANWTNVGSSTNSFTTPPTTTGDSGTSVRVIVTNSAGSVTSSAVALTVNPSGGGGGTTSGPVAINSGGPAVGPFQADVDFTGGSTASVTTAIDTSAATNPAPQAVYQSERWGAFTYSMPGLTPGGPYTVRLHFAETVFTSTGQRVFNVSINGTSVLANFDIVATAGAPNKATTQTFTTTADGGGQISVAFIQGPANWPKLSGLEVIAGSSGGGGGGGGVGGGGGSGTTAAAGGSGGGSHKCGMLGIDLLIPLALVGVFRRLRTRGARRA